MRKPMLYLGAAALAALALGACHKTQDAGASSAAPAESEAAAVASDASAAPAASAAAPAESSAPGRGDPTRQ